MSASIRTPNAVRVCPADTEGALVVPFRRAATTMCAHQRGSTLFFDYPSILHKFVDIRAQGDRSFYLVPRMMGCSRFFFLSFSPVFHC